MRSLLPLLAAALLAPTPAFAQYGGSRCVQIVAYVAPDLLRCQQSGTDYLGRAIWTCC